MSKRSNDVLIQDIKESAEKIKRYAADISFEAFIADEKTVDAVIRNFEIIGEAASRVSDDFKEQHSNIDWYKIRGFRNRIVHDYAGIDLQIVWMIMTDFLPTMLEEIKEL